MLLLVLIQSSISFGFSIADSGNPVARRNCDAVCFFCPCLTASLPNDSSKSANGFLTTNGSSKVGLGVEVDFSPPVVAVAVSPNNSAVNLSFSPASFFKSFAICFLVFFLERGVDAANNSACASSTFDNCAK